MSKLVELIVDKYDGSLKAEHGTGINMAPYVEREWGKLATELMWRVKKLAEPEGVLASGVVLNRDPGVHLRNLKTTPATEEAVTTCVECGFCEPVCPSRDLTTTPRQRIVLRREIARQPEGSRLRRALLDEYESTGWIPVRSTAPVGWPAHWASTPVSWRRSCGLRATRRAGRDSLCEPPGAGAQWNERREPRCASAGRWRAAPGAALHSPARRRGGSRRPTARRPPLSTCPPAPIFGRGTSGPNLPEALVEVSARAGMPVWIPPDLAGSCCGLPWSSKGFGDAHRLKANEMVERLWHWSGEGEVPVVIDAASCTQALARPGVAALGEESSTRLEGIEILDSVAWAHDRLLPRLDVRRKVGTAAVHPTCATRELGLAPRLRSLAGALAEEVFVPPSATCCGFAGDRGILHPELTASATAEQAAELSGREFDAHLCSNRTCEIGLSRATGSPYESFVFLLEELTRSG